MDEELRRTGSYQNQISDMKRILIIDDHAVVRSGLRRIIGDQTEPALFGEAQTPREALKLVLEQDWDLAILDLSLNGQSGLELLKELKQIRPVCRC